MTNKQAALIAAATHSPDSIDNKPEYMLKLAGEFLWWLDNPATNKYVECSGGELRDKMRPPAKLGGR